MANPFEIRSIDVERLRVPLKAPFVTALGAKTETENVRVRARLASGAEGWGEASSSVVQAHLTPERLERTLARLAPAALGSDARRWRSLASEARARAGAATAAAAALECAVVDALTRQLGVTMARFFGGALDSVETDLTLSAWPPPQARQAAREAVRAGFRVLKVKVGTGPREDLARAKAAAAARPRPSLVLDGNQRLTRRGALALVERCLAAGARVEALEQPLDRADLEGLRRLSRDCPVPVVADESARSLEEAARVLATGAASGINVKVAKTGLAESLEIISLARCAGAPLMIGCMQETSLGLSAGVHLACGTGAFRWIDLDSDVLLAERKAEGRYRRKGPRVTVSAS